MQTSYAMTRAELNEALTAVAYFANAHRLLSLRDTLETLAELEEGTATLQGRHAIEFLVEDYHVEHISA